MARYSYALGTSNPPTNVEDFATPLYPPRGRYFEAAAFVDKLDGHQAGRGNPYALWHFDILTQDMVNALRVICPGESAAVYITTRKNDGTYGTFSAVMLWPHGQMEKRQFLGRYLGLDFMFRKLVAV